MTSKKVAIKTSFCNPRKFQVENDLRRIIFYVPLNFLFLWIQEKAKETREKVKLLLQLADTLVDKGHAHAPSIKKWVEDVDATYKDFR